MTIMYVMIQETIDHPESMASVRSELRKTHAAPRQVVFSANHVPSCSEPEIGSFHAPCDSKAPMGGGCCPPADSGSISAPLPLRTMLTHVP